MALLSLPPCPSTTSVHEHQNPALNSKKDALINNGNMKIQESGEDDPLPLVPNVVTKREWKFWDVYNVCWTISVHFLCLFAPFKFDWGAFWVAIALGIITGLLGITLCYHRLLSHKSFKLPKWLEYVFAYCGVLAAQRGPIFWVSAHRIHHQFSDTPKDPHNRMSGFWFSHMAWTFDNESLSEKREKCNNVRDLEKQPFYKFLERTYLIHSIVPAPLLYAIGGFPYIVWGMGVRVVLVYHITWSVNSVGHHRIWGKNAWKNGDLSRNNWWLALMTFGEGWHNNHHVFEYSARHGLEWWQIDMTWYIIKVLEIVGLATDIKLPTSAQKQKMTLTK